MAYRYFIRLAFDGAAYCGWQLQPNGLSVQQLLHDGLKFTSHVSSGVTGCGRTDAGVHAGIFYAHFDADAAYSQQELAQMVFRLNRFLPDDISIESVVPVVPSAHARFSADWREYEYTIIRRKDPFRYRKAYFVHENLNVELMNFCSGLLLGTRDFQCFSKTHTQVANYICDIQHAAWKQEGHVLVFTIRANRFLRNMVRAVVGTLLDAGRGRLTAEGFMAILESRNRSNAGLSVPAAGLMLTGVHYPKELFAAEPVFFSQESPDEEKRHHQAGSQFHDGAGQKSDE